VLYCPCGLPELITQGQPRLSGCRIPFGRSTDRIFMIASFLAPDDSKFLYFSLNNSLRLSNVIFSQSNKLAGIYVILKEESCYYVGQSLNIASRLSTHLTGKYSNCDEIRIFCPTEHDYSNFYENSIPGQRQILENNEAHGIETFKPIENILVDREKEIDCPCLFNTCGSLDECEITIYIKHGHITIFDYDTIDIIDKRVTGCQLDKKVVLGAV